jgi:hypothetical protein
LGFEQESAQGVLAVLHPAAESQAAAQHSLPNPTVQAVVAGVQEHGLQVPAPSQVLEHDAG